MQRELVLQACQTDSSAGVHAGELDLTGAPGALQHPWTEEWQLRAPAAASAAPTSAGC